MRSMEHRGFEETVQLVRSAQAGDRQASEVLFERYLGVVRRIVALRMGRRLAEFEDYEDIVQETLLDAFRSLDDFEPRSEGSFRNWLARLVENELCDTSRRANAQKRGAGRVRPFAAYDSGLLGISTIRSRDPSPSEGMRVEDMEAQLESTLLSMNDRDRRIIELRRYCGMTYDEIREEMQLGSESSARALFSRALSNLAQKL